MKLFLISILLIMSSNIVLPQEKSFIRDYTYHASERDSKLSAREKALVEVKKLLFEELGTYIESETRYTQFESNKTYSETFINNIQSLTAGITKTKIIEEKWNGNEYYLKVSMNVDIKKMNEIMDKLVAEKTSSVPNPYGGGNQIAYPNLEQEKISLSTTIVTSVIIPGSGLLFSKNYLPAAIYFAGSIGLYVGGAALASSPDSEITGQTMMIIGGVIHIASIIHTIFATNNYNYSILPSYNSYGYGFKFQINL